MDQSQNKSLNASTKNSPTKDAKEVFKFKENEKVLCYHGPLLYEAKCIKSQFQDKQAKYFIHYSGWNKNWDEWVPETRVLKYNEANLQKQKELESAHLKTKKIKLTQKKKENTKIEEKVKKTISKLAEENTSKKKKSSRLDSNVENDENIAQDEIKVKIKLPVKIKTWLVEDWNQVNNHKMLLKLPAKPSVEEVMSDFCKQPMPGKPSVTKQSIRREVMNGVRDFFNFSLGSHLLYKFERYQYGTMQDKYPDSQPSQLFGLTHLIRLFTKLGLMLESLKMEDESSVQMLLDYIHDFLNYLADSHSFSASHYQEASPQYSQPA